MMYAVYQISSGQILRLVSCPPSMLELNVPVDHSVVPVDPIGSDEAHWVDHVTGTIHTKEDYPLEQLPLPCTVTIEGTEYPCAEQPVFEFDAPGEYVIEVDAGPRFLKKEFTYDYQP
jgi:hypothetical protein